MSIETLLNNLNKVKKTNYSTWIACCPAHDDRNPSLSIRVVDDGRVLIHCFAGCDANEILEAVGLSFDALYPESFLGRTYKPLRKVFDATSALKLLQFESSLVLEYAKTINRGSGLSNYDLERLSRANERIQRVCEAGGLE
jgi:hypothetical protein